MTETNKQRGRERGREMDRKTHRQDDLEPDKGRQTIRKRKGDIDRQTNIERMRERERVNMNNLRERN